MLSDWLFTYTGFPGAQTSMPISEGARARSASALKRSSSGPSTPSALITIRNLPESGTAQPVSPIRALAFAISCPAAAASGAPRPSRSVQVERGSGSLQWTPLIVPPPEAASVADEIAETGAASSAELRIFSLNGSCPPARVDAAAPTGSSTARSTSRTPPTVNSTLPKIDDDRCSGGGVAPAQSRVEAFCSASPATQPGCSSSRSACTMLALSLTSAPSSASASTVNSGSAPVSERIEQTKPRSACSRPQANTG